MKSQMTTRFPKGNITPVRLLDSKWVRVYRNLPQVLPDQFQENNLNDTSYDKGILRSLSSLTQWHSTSCLIPSLPTAAASRTKAYCVFVAVTLTWKKNSNTASSKVVIYLTAWCHCRISFFRLISEWRPKPGNYLPTQQPQSLLLSFQFVFFAGVGCCLRHKWNLSNMKLIVKKQHEEAQALELRATTSKSWPKITDASSKHIRRISATGIFLRKELIKASHHRTDIFE